MRAGARGDRLPAGDTGVRVATGLALAFAVTLLAVVIWAAHPAQAPAPGVRSADPVLVGVVEGQSVPGYLDHSRGELDSLLRAPAGTPTWALVSLAGYYPPDRLAPLLGGAAVAQVYARAPIRDVRTQVVRIPAYRLPDDVVAGMLAAAVHRDREQADYRRLGRDLDGAGPQVSRLRRAYESAASVAAAEAHAYRAHCACVFAAVVRADPLALRRIADRAEVRAVDPAPEVGAPEGAEFRPPLPEQSGALPQLTRSATTPAPSGAQAVAPVRPAPLPSASGSSVTSASPDGPGAGSGPSPPASEERPAVPSAPVPIPGSDAPVTAPGASRGASGR